MTGDQGASGDGFLARPVLRVVHGAPDDAEIAAVTAVLTAIAARTSDEPPRRESPLWTDRAALVRAPLVPGPGAWRASGLPR